MIETTLSRCDICGSFPGESGCCQICGTVLIPGKVECELCGDPLSKFSPICDTCGTMRGEKVEKKVSSKKKEVIHHLMLVPGMNEETASGLYDDGVRDLASLIGMSLTEKQREEGLHQVIARRIMLSDVLKNSRDLLLEEMECPYCRGLIEASAERCEICGHSTTKKPDVEESDKEVDPRMKDVTDEISQNTAFREMPIDFQEEMSDILKELEDEDIDDQEAEEELSLVELEIDDIDDQKMEELQLEKVEDQSVDDQETAEESPLEEVEVVDIDDQEIVEESKTEKVEDQSVDDQETEDASLEEVSSDTFTMVCPLCNTEVLPEAHFCHNCGAKFKEA